MSLIVSTDLDGTLLDHFSYRWDEALPAIKRLKAAGIPIVINTSKTAAEVHVLQAKLDVHDAFIVENGSALFIPVLTADEMPENYDPDYYAVKVLGETREKIKQCVYELREKHNFVFEGYSDWALADLVAKTGLSEYHAELSMSRSYSEPLIWNDSPERLTQFVEMLDALGLATLQGGRFLHVLGQVNKGKAVRCFAREFSGDQAVKIAALGDSQNDAAMLEASDYPIWIKSPSHDFPEIEIDRVRYSTAMGPAGWNETLHILLDELHL